MRLALIRVGLELFGRDVVRASHFPWIRAASVLVRPPERVALSSQVLRAYKADAEKGQVSFRESVVYRQMAHAQGTMTVYVELPRQEREAGETLLGNIGYWGQASSFATCLEVREGAPLRSECAQPLNGLSEQSVLRPFFSGVLTEFRDLHVTWREVVPFDDIPTRAAHNPLKLEVYVWPLQTVRQDGQNTLLIRMPFQ